MIPKIQKILYATDLSPNSKYAFRYAINSAIQHDAKIIMLHVIESMPSAVYAQKAFQVGGDQAKKIFEKRVDDALGRIKERLKIFCEKELAGNPKAMDRIQSIEICEGFPAEEILEKAQDLDCDAIVMGTHSKGIIANTFLGSIAKSVLGRTRKPVFIIPLPKGETEIAFPSDEGF
jgi:nucleotide-binding universal stress UspA family protein